MLRIVFSLCLSLFCVTMASAGDTDLRLLQTSDEGRGWEAVGRLDINGEGFCTGALIAEDQVLTAAHCLFDPDTGELIDATEIEFRAGWRNGRASAYRWVRRAVIHPDYDFGAAAEPVRVRHDIALLQLMQPIRTTRVKPFKTRAQPASGEDIGVVSYAHDRSEAPSLQELCHVIARQTGVLIMSCDVDFGSSGAPVFSFSDGEPQIVSVVSAKAEADGAPVSLGTSLDGPIEILQSKLARASQFRSVNERRDNGAKFVRP